MGKNHGVSLSYRQGAWWREHRLVAACTRSAGWVAERLLLFTVLFVCASHGHAAQAQGRLEGASPTQSASALPVVHEDIRVEVDQQSARIVIEQQFRNPSSERLEGRYL